MKIAVIGAGIAGIMAAYFLQKDGHKVTIFDQERYAAMHTSRSNGGQVSVSNSETWTSWSNIRKGISWMLQPGAPLSIGLAPTPAKIAWLARFLWHTARGDQTANTIETIKLGVHSRELLKQIAQQEGLEFDQTPCGILHFYKYAEYFEAAKKSQTLYAQAGHEQEWNVIDSNEVKTIEPALRPVPGIVGGVWTPADWTGDIHKFCIDLVNLLQQRGAEFWHDFQIGSLDTLDDFDRIVVSAGADSERFAKMTGDRFDIYPVKGYSITIPAEGSYARSVLPKASLLDDQAKIVTATLGTRFRVAGTAELAGHNRDIRRARIEPLLDWVHTNFPNIDTKNYTSWACLRPMTPNMMPIVQRSRRNPKVWYHTGHGHLGWTLAAGTAEMLAKQLV